MSTSTRTVRDEHGRPVNRTCEECRLRKIRCLQFSDDSHATGTPCVRCVKLNLGCVFLASRKVGKKGPRKVNETRINNIERKFEALREAVAHGKPAANISSHAAVEVPENEPDGDALDKELVTPDVAETLFETFETCLAPLVPIVACPLGLTWEVARKIRPAFFRAAITAAAISEDASLAETLLSETERFLIDQAVLKGYKSLDLLQGLLILSIWHHPPSKFQDFKFSQFVHVAATMVMDLRASQDPHFRIPHQRASASGHSEDVIETCRTFLACYLCCSGLALCFRRPNILRYGSWVNACLDVLLNSGNPSQHDRQLVAWVRLCRIGEDGAMATGIDEETATNTSDVRIRYALRGCVRQVHSWRASVADEDMTVMMAIDQSMILLSLHEPAMYGTYDESDFRPPFALHPSSHPVTGSSKVATDDISARAQLIASAHNLVNGFASLPTQQLHMLPTIAYPRMVYALTVIAKFTVTTADYAGGADAEPSQVSGLDGTIARLLFKLAESASQSPKCIIPAIFHLVVSRIRDWYETCRSGRLGQNGESLKPMRTLNLDDAEGTGEHHGTKSSLAGGTGPAVTGHAPEQGLSGILSPGPLLGRSMMEICGGSYDDAFTGPSMYGVSSFEQQY